MPRKRCSLLWVLAVVSIVGVTAASAPVLQPTDPSLSFVQRVALLRAADEIGRLLNNPLYASQQSVGEGGWTHAQFAAYTAGWLSTQGYRVLLAGGASASGTPDTWVLVEVVASGTTLYVPVNASPPPGSIQTTLGVVPLVSGAFDPAFLAFNQTASLPANAPPIAAASAAFQAMDMGGAVFSFDGGASIDPDGRIALYIWTWDDGDQLSQPFPTTSHGYRHTGSFAVTLTVVDPFGAMATTSLLVDVVVAREPIDPSGGPVCSVCHPGG